MISIKENTYQFKLGDLLGAGTFGSVFKCIRTADKQAFALKTIEKSKLQQHGDYLIEALEREIATQTIATQSGIPFYVGLYDNFEDEKMIYMVMELCEKSLNKQVEGIKVNENTCLDYVFQVGIGLEYLHSIGICHRDIKTENILIKDNLLKIADFGFATQSKILSTHLGTKPYMSPEFFQNTGDEEYTPKIDVWALNTCLYFLLSKKYYFFSHNPVEMERQIVKKEFVVELSLQYLTKHTQELLKLGYIKNPKIRPTMSEYVAHPAFDSIRGKYSKYLNTNKTNNLQDLNFDALKIEQKILVDSKPSTEYPIYLLNFRSNLLIYPRLAKSLQAKQFSRIWVFLLIKRHLQYLIMICVHLKEDTVPNFEGFANIDFDKNQWDFFTKTNTFTQISGLLFNDLRTVSFTYSQTFKDLLNSTKDTSNLPLFDLNINYKKEIVDFCQRLNSKVQTRMASKPSPELEKLGKSVQIILLYEAGDASRMILEANNINT